MLGNGALGTGVVWWPEGRKEEYSGGGEFFEPMGSSHCPLPLIFYKRLWWRGKSVSVCLAVSSCAAKATPQHKHLSKHNFKQYVYPIGGCTYEFQQIVLRTDMVLKYCIYGIIKRRHLNNYDLRVQLRKKPVSNISPYSAITENLLMKWWTKSTVYHNFDSWKPL